MGLSFARPISADFSIRAFAQRGEENADGWGLGWYPDQSLAIVKEPVRWQASKYTTFIENYHAILSSIYLAHVRHRTVGGPPTHADTQPFRRELRGRDYCFAHNGTITSYDKLPLGRFRPVGATDSERLFCALLAALERRKSDLDSEDDWRWLHAKLRVFNRRGTLNLLLSDGRRLFCYHDRTGHNGMVYRPIRVRNHETRRFEDEEIRLDLEGEAANHGLVIASHPLRGQGWQRIQPGELLVLAAGVICYSSQRDPVTAQSLASDHSQARTTVTSSSSSLR
jgi:glutamine amidotransferase